MSEVTIVGQGLAGSLLGWELERAGIAFSIVDRGHDTAATRAAGAGIINPVTGRRLVKSWRVDELLPVARAAYQEIQHALGVTLWHDMRVRRLFADARERAAYEAKRTTGELAPYAGGGDEEGFWIEGAARVELRPLLASLQERWRGSGRLREGCADVAMELRRGSVVVDCSGVAGARGEAFGFVPWEFSKGEVLELETAGLAREVILNCRHWVAPAGEGRAWVGATHEPGVTNAEPSAAGREALERSARRLLRGELRVIGHTAGVRVNLPDKRPVVGRHPREPRLGTINGLAAKGALWAPWLARQWVAHLRDGKGFEAEVAVGRAFHGRTERTGAR